MTKILVVGMGGFIGSILRYLTNLGVAHFVKQPWFPWGTLVVNILGCLGIGIISALFTSRNLVNSEWWLFWVVGILGGFTTFSAFGYETHSLLQQHQPFLAIINVTAQVFFGLAAVWFGYNLVSRVL
jgi:CrcB protein